eukprot:7564794-Heterocapsa_arctica.AAC.1
MLVGSQDRCSRTVALLDVVRGPMDVLEQLDALHQQTPGISHSHQLVDPKCRGVSRGRCFHSCQLVQVGSNVPAAQRPGIRLHDCQGLAMEVGGRYGACQTATRSQEPGCDPRKQSRQPVPSEPADRSQPLTLHLQALLNGFCM